MTTPRRRHTPDGSMSAEDGPVDGAASSTTVLSSTTRTRTVSAGDATIRVQVTTRPCAKLMAPDAAYAASVRASTEAARVKLVSRIRTLHPGTCRNVGPFLLMATTWLLWSVAAPLALLLFVRANPHVARADAMKAVGWSLMGTGAAYLLWTLAPILTRGLLCMPSAPENDGPFLRRAQTIVDADTPSTAEQPRPPSFALQPQVPTARVLDHCCVYILLNGHGRHGASATSKAKACFDALKLRGCCVHQIETQYAGHLRDLGLDPLLLPLEHAAPDDVDASLEDAHPAGASGIAAVLIVGGDGSMSEYVNGYLQRCETLRIEPSARTPIGLIPAGSGNSLARDLYSSNLTSALACILNGETQMLDVSLVTDEAGSRLYSTNVISYGMVGETAVIAEDYRALGDLRYDLCAVASVMRQVTSSASFALRNLGGEFNAQLGQPMRFDGESGSSRALVSLSGRKTTAFINQTQYFGKALRACPHAKLDDGLLDVIVCEAAPRNILLTMFQQLPAGKHLKNSAVSYYQVQQAQITEPLSEERDPSLSSTVINIDGENVVVTGSVTVTARLRQIPVFAPRSA